MKYMYTIQRSRLAALTKEVNLRHTYFHNELFTFLNWSCVRSQCKEQQQPIDSDQKTLTDVFLNLLDSIYTFYLHNMQLIRCGSYFVYLTYEKWRHCTYMNLCLNFNNMWVYFVESPLFTFTSRLFNGDNIWLTYIIFVLLTEMPIYIVLPKKLLKNVNLLNFPWWHIASIFDYIRIQITMLTYNLMLLTCRKISNKTRSKNCRNYHLMTASDIHLASWNLYMSTC